MKYYSGIKKKVLPFATIWMDPEGTTMLSELGQIQKDKF